MISGWFQSLIDPRADSHSLVSTSLLLTASILAGYTIAKFPSAVLDKFTETKYIALIFFIIFYLNHYTNNNLSFTTKLSYALFDTLLYLAIFEIIKWLAFKYGSQSPYNSQTNSGPDPIISFKYGNKEDVSDRNSEQSSSFIY